jgi:hypothetical protein
MTKATDSSETLVNAYQVIAILMHTQGCTRGVTAATQYKELIRTLTSSIVLDGGSFACAILCGKLPSCVSAHIAALANTIQGDPLKRGRKLFVINHTIFYQSKWDAKEINKVFQKELRNFEILHKFIQRTCTVF